MSTAPPTDLLGHWDELLTDVEREKLRSLRALLEERARPHLADWWEAAESPAHLRQELAALRLEDDPALLGDDGRPSPFYIGFKHFEFARFDLSIGTVYGGQVGMFRTVVREGGSPEQVAELDPRIASSSNNACSARSWSAGSIDVSTTISSSTRPTRSSRTSMIQSAT